MTVQSKRKGLLVDFRQRKWIEKENGIAEWIFFVEKSFLKCYYEK